MQPGERMYEYNWLLQVNDRNIFVELVLIFLLRLPLDNNWVYDIAYCDFGNSNTVWYISPPWAAGWWWWWWCGYKYSFGMGPYTGQQCTVQCSVPARLQTLSHFNYCQLLITTHPYIIKLYSNTCATTTPPSCVL